MYRKICVLIFLCLFCLPAKASGLWTYESGAWKSVPTWWTYQSGAWKSVNEAWVYESGAWKLFFTSLSVTANNVSEVVTSNVGNCTSATSGTPAAAVTGGSGSFTYAWSYQSGDTGIVTNPNSTVLNPTFSASPQLCAVSGGDAQVNAVWKIVVTDTVTSSTANTSISVHLEYNRP